MRNPVRPALALAIASTAVALAGCGGGPSSDEVAAWEEFALYRQGQHVAEPVQGPRSVKEYVLGATGAYAARYEGADSILTGKFTGAVTTTDPASGQTEVVAIFLIHAPVMGQLTGSVDIVVGDAAPGVDMDAAVRGAGNAVVFLVDDGGSWRLADGLYSICPTDKDGRLSMPLVELDARSAYLSGVIDVADVSALLIAAAHDPGGILDGGNSGVNDPQQNLIDKANDLAG
jgi:hypothetical protein